MSLDLEPLRRKADAVKVQQEIRAVAARQEHQHAAEETAGKGEERKQRWLEERVEAAHEKLIPLLEKAADNGKRTVTFEKFDNHDTSWWGCGKCETSTFFSHSHSKRCFSEEAAAVWNMLEQQGLRVSLKAHAGWNKYNSLDGAYWTVDLTF